MKFLLDTNIVSGIARRLPLTVERLRWTRPLDDRARWDKRVFDNVFA